MTPKPGHYGPALPWKPVNAAKSSQRLRARARHCYAELLFSIRKAKLMQAIENKGISSASVNYDDLPIVELEVDGIAYRLDTGHGSAVAVSQRTVGTWTWIPVTEGRWDGSRLRAKGLDYQVVTALAEALGAAMRNREEQGTV